MDDLVPGKKYSIRLKDDAKYSLNHDFGISMDNVEFARSYEDKRSSKTSLVFKYAVSYERFPDWIGIWSHVGINFTIQNGTKGTDIEESQPFILETHMYDFCISEIIPYNFET
jgi:hypothetical protein